MRCPVNVAAKIAPLARARYTVVGLLLLGIGASFPARADPLDQLTGMESWKQIGSAIVGDEWKDWQRLRIQWRNGRRDIRHQREISQRLARLLSQPRGPTFETVLRVLQLPRP